MTDRPLTGGCQCGAVRYRIGELGRASICHCRMCQKAFGGFFAPLVTARTIEWSRGKPAWFASSNKVRRGFCADCGTPMIYDWGGPLEIAIGTLDDPERAPPTLQIGVRHKLSYVDSLPALPPRGAAEDARAEEFMADIVSRQHPDHDTDAWSPGQAGGDGSRGEKADR